MTRPVRPVALVILTACMLYPGLTLLWQGLNPFVAGDYFNLMGQTGPWMAAAAKLGLPRIVPLEAVQRLAEQGFLGMAIPEEWGGVGYDSRTIMIVLEEIARISAALAIMIAVHNSVGALPVFRFGTDEQRRRFLPRLVSRELGAFSLSEPGAGSDAAALRSTAVRDGAHYVLNG